MDVYSIRTAENNAIYDYRWSDSDFKDRQIEVIFNGRKIQ
jgi:hypothetical protein